MEEEKPNIEQFKELLKNTNEGPVVMLNLLKFKPEGGLASYARYAKEAGKFLRNVGGKATYIGKMKELLIGYQTWDAVILVQYPSRKDYLRMINNPDYLEIHNYRATAIERSVLYATDEMGIRDLLSV